jgi:hypothetical protein
MSSFTRVVSFEASYSAICRGDGSTALAARIAVDGKNRKESAQKTVRIPLDEMLGLKLNISPRALIAVESTVYGEEAAAVIVNTGAAADGIGINTINVEDTGGF